MTSSRMGTGYLVFAASLIIVTIISRAIPMDSTINNRPLFSALFLVSLIAAYFVFRKYRFELKRINKPSRLFPFLMSSITLLFLIQLAMRMS